LDGKNRVKTDINPDFFGMKIAADSLSALALKKF
jgi:hypothetical protein